MNVLYASLSHFSIFMGFSQCLETRFDMVFDHSVHVFLSNLYTCIGVPRYSITTHNIVLCTKKMSKMIESAYLEGISRYSGVEDMKWESQQGTETE